MDGQNKNNPTTTKEQRTEGLPDKINNILGSGQVWERALLKRGFETYTIKSMGRQINFLLLPSHCKRIQTSGAADTAEIGAKKKKKREIPN